MTLTSELYRKSFHINLIIIPILFCYLGKTISLAILLPVSAIVIGLDFYRRKNPKIQNLFLKIFSKILRLHEIDGQKLCGASFVFLSASLTFGFALKEIAVTSFVILAISDTLASLVGKSVKSQPFFDKTFAGSMAFFISALVVVIVNGIIFKTSFLFYFFGFFCALITTLIEARSNFLDLDDNFLIPISFSLSMGIFNYIWNFI
ncbi:MAG: diacylglycerol/polyprenol kinase family protein [Alphaproteobacteria bacterium]